jgi:hypothetical protein
MNVFMLEVEEFFLRNVCRHHSSSLLTLRSSFILVLTAARISFQFEKEVAILCIKPHSDRVDQDDYDLALSNNLRHVRACLKKNTSNNWRILIEMKLGF